MASDPSIPRIAAGSARAVWLGCACVLLAIFGFSTGDAIAKMMTIGYGALVVLFMRSIAGMLSLGVVSAVRRSATFRVRQWRIQMLSTALLMGGLLSGYSALALMPLPDVSAIVLAAPLFATALSALILREPLDARRIVGMLVGVGGAAVIAVPEVIAARSGDAGQAIQSPWGPVLAVGAALGYAGVAVCLRVAGRTDSAAASAFCQLAGQFVVSGAILLAVPGLWRTPAPGDLPLLMLLGAMGTLGQVSLGQAMRLAPVSAVISLEYTYLLFAAVYGWVLFDELPSLPTYIGAPLIIGGGLYVALRSSRSAQA